MSDIAEKVWHAFKLDRAEPEHPLRRLVEEHRRLEESNEKFLQLSREHGQQRDAARRERDALRGFAQAVMADWPEGGPDMFGLQDMAVEHGLLKLTDDPVREPCGEHCWCASYFDPGEFAEGVECYRRTPLLKGEP